MSIAPGQAAAQSPPPTSADDSAISTAPTSTPTTAAPSAPAIGDSTQTATISFNVCPQSCAGIHVFIDSASNHYGASGLSLCTANETSTDFWPRYNGETRQISMLAKAGFATSCASQPSYNTWMIEVYKNNQRVGRGLVWLGEDQPILAKYYATCDAKYSPWKPVWNNSELKCSDDQRFHVTVSVPNYRPTYPRCPATTEYCSIGLHLDATLYCPNITASVGACLGKSTGNPEWVTNGVENERNLIYSTFTWADGGRTMANFGTVRGIPICMIFGYLPSGSTDTLVVRDATLFVWEKPATHWFTSTKGPAGTPGGPLVFHFQNGVVGADVYIQGFLQLQG